MLHKVETWPTEAQGVQWCRAGALLEHQASLRSNAANPREVNMPRGAEHGKAESLSRLSRATTTARSKGSTFRRERPES